jgi:hypothetical protein
MNASDRPNTCKSRDSVAIHKTGARVSNAYATCLQQGDSSRKRELTPHKTTVPHGTVLKITMVVDGHA